MSNEKSQKAQVCPHCGKEVDPLRAPAVSVVDGAIVHFCSPSCREEHLDRATGEEILSSVDAPPTSPAEERPRREEPPARSKNLPEPKRPNNEYRSVFIRNQLIEFAALAVLIAVVVGVPPLIGGRLPLAIIALESIVLIGLGIFRDRRLGAARISESAAVPLAALAVLFAGFLSGDNRGAALAAAVLLFARSLGRLLELLGRQRSGVLATIERKSTRAVPSSWRDNSTAASRLRRVALVLEAARYPLALVVGGAVYVGYSGSLVEALLATATALVSLGPRTLRMITGDAHLAAGLATKARGAAIRDAHIVEQVAAARSVLFVARRSLLTGKISVVDWQTVPESDEERSLAALGSLEAQVSGPIAEAIREFVQSRGVACVPFEEPEVRAGTGVAGATSAGRTLVGSRALLIGEHVSSALLEDEAQVIESSGRRALFLAIGDELVAVFGVEEHPLPGLRELTTRLRRRGLQPILMTSAELEPAQIMAGRMGIEQIRFETGEDQLGMILGQLRESGEKTLLVGHGAAFEESIRAADAALAFGGDQPSQAGVDARGQPVEIIGNVIDTARHAARSVRVNLTVAGVAMSIGIGLAASWFAHFVPVFAGALSFGAAALCTLNGPYPLLDSASHRLRRLLRSLEKRLPRT